jgi:hypothetical protein
MTYEALKAVGWGKRECRLLYFPFLSVGWKWKQKGFVSCWSWESGEREGGWWVRTNKEE